MFTKHHLTYFSCNKKILIQKKFNITSPVFQWSNAVFSLATVYTLTGVEPSFTTFIKKSKKCVSFIRSNSFFFWKKTNSFFFQVLDKFSLLFLSYVDNIGYLKQKFNIKFTHINVHSSDCVYNPEVFNIFVGKLKSVYLYSFWFKIRCLKYLVVSDFLRLIQLPLAFKIRNLLK